MMCPICVDQGTRSRVTPGDRFTTLMGHSPYYDEDGQYHIHDPNTVTVEYGCSHGHRWEEKPRMVCGAPDCGWDA